MEKFDDINKGLLEERLPNAYERALRVSKKAESLIYMVLVKSLEELSDVAIDLDASDPVCRFFDNWDNSGYIDGALVYADIEDGKKRLTCRFDLYGIRDTFETLSSDLFGTISGDYSKKLDAAGEMCFSSEEANSLEKGIQKVNLPRVNN